VVWKRWRKGGRLITEVVLLAECGNVEKLKEEKRTKRKRKR
jgi:hypothetical protein